MKAKVVRYFVERHRNRDGSISRRCWDVRVSQLDEFGIEHDQGKLETFPTRSDAQIWADAWNSRVKKAPRMP